LLNKVAHNYATAVVHNLLVSHVEEKFFIRSVVVGGGGGGGKKQTLELAIVFSQTTYKTVNPLQTTASP
jgi:Flp pilus assembly CpaF family ATPase